MAIPALRAESARAGVSGPGASDAGALGGGSAAVDYVAVGAGVAGGVV